VVSCGIVRDEADARAEASLLDSLGFDGRALRVSDWASFDPCEGWAVCACGMESSEIAARTASGLLWHWPDARGEIVHDGPSRCTAEPAVAGMSDLAGLIPPLRDHAFSVPIPASWECEVTVATASDREEWECPVHVRQALPGWRLECWEDPYLGPLEVRAFRRADPGASALFGSIRNLLAAWAPLLDARVIESPGEYILLHRLPDASDRAGDVDFWVALCGDSLEYGYTCRTFYGEMPYSREGIPRDAVGSPLPRAFADPEEGVGLVIDRLVEDGVLDPDAPGGASFGMEPMDGFPADAWRDYADVAWRESHAADGPGDTLTAPVIERFRIYARTGEILWFRMPEGEWASYAEFLAGRADG